jgi:hypothetical protein
MVVRMNAARKNEAPVSEGENAKADTYKVTGIGSYKNQSDFEKVAKEIASGVSNYANLMHSASVAALVHYDKHGNSLVFKPLWDAAKTFSAGEGRKWFTYNPLKLRGEKLASADFNTLFKRDKSKVSDVDGAKAKHWRDHKVTRQSVTRPVDIRKQVATMIKSLQALLNANRLVVMTADGKGIAKKAGAADVRAEVKAALEQLTNVRLVADNRKNTGPAGVRNPNTQTRRSPETATPTRKPAKVEAKATRKRAA